MSFIPKVHEIAGGRGNYMRTFSGKRFYPFDPRVEEIDILDIAHSLSNQCRWAGHSLKFLSVAEHCYWVSMFKPTDDDIVKINGVDGLQAHSVYWNFKTFSLERLMHDAAEGYLQDMIRPLKYMPNLGSEYQKLEHKMESVIATRFKLTHPWPISVKVADEAVCELEAQTNVRDFEYDEGALHDSKIVATLPLQFWSPEVAEQKFLERFYELSAKRI